MKRLLFFLCLALPPLSAPLSTAQTTTAHDPRLTQAFHTALLDAERAWLSTNPDRSFLSVGNDLEYALGWLKNSRYVEAMTPLGLIGPKGAEDPFVHLFTAFALAGQGKAHEAQEALANAVRRLPALKAYTPTITAYVSATSPASSQAAPKTPTHPVRVQPSSTLNASIVKTMSAALNEAERLWKATRPSTGMFSTAWHVEQILYNLRNQNPEGAKIQIDAARSALKQTARSGTDRAFLDLLDAFASAQRGQRTLTDQALSDLATSPYSTGLKPVTDFLRAYQLPKVAPAPTKTPDARPGGPLMGGSYSCWLERPGLNGTRNDLPKGTLTLKTNGTYTYMGKGGTYRYNAQTGLLVFTSGFFTNPVPERTTFIKHPRTAQLDIHWAYANDWSCGMNY